MMRCMRLACGLLLLLLSVCFPAGSARLPATQPADASCLPLTPTNADGNYIVPGARGGVVYHRAPGRELKLDYWVPPNRGSRDSRSATPGVEPSGLAVIVIHGGGFSTGSRVAFVGQFLEMLEASGHTWLSIEYRLGGPSRAAESEDDVAAAVAFTRCHAADLGVDPDRIILLGEDTGAVLAARIAARPAAGAAGAILIGGAYARLPSYAGANTTRGRVNAPPLSPPVPQAPSNVERSPGGVGSQPGVTPGARAGRRGAAPGFLVVHGTADAEAPLAEADSWCSRVRADGARCELVPVDGARHRPENWWPVQWGYKRRVVRWLDAAAGAPPVPPKQPPPTDLTKPLAPGLYKRIAYTSPPDARAVADIAPSASAAVQPGSDIAPPVARTLDAWLPRDRPNPGPAVVLLHGGGWEAGDRVTYIAPLFEPLAQAGFAWFSIDYRLTPAVSHPEQLNDLRAALGFIRDHAGIFRIDPRRVVLVGESASGQMVTLLAAGDRTLAGVVSFYGVYDFLPMVADAGPRSLAARLFGRTVLDDETRQTLREYSPLTRAAAGMPPVLLIHGTNERLWDQGVRMAERLGELGVDHELLVLEGAPHGMENWEGRAEWQFYKARLVSWIRQRAGLRFDR
jgi:acetyl esterase